jgi:hypothetical protein
MSMNRVAGAGGLVGFSHNMYLEAYYKGSGYIFQIHEI